MDEKPFVYKKSQLRSALDIAKLNGRLRGMKNSRHKRSGNLSRFDIAYVKTCDFIGLHFREEVPMPLGKKIKISLITLWGVFINGLSLIVVLDIFITDSINLIYNILLKYGIV